MSHREENVVVGARPEEETMNTEKRNSNTVRLVVAAVVVAIVVAFVVAVVMGDSDDDASTPSADVSTSTVVDSDDGVDEDSAAGENQPVVVVGDALEPLTDPADDSAVGRSAPTLEGARFDGSSFVIDPADGTDRLVVFLAHWCPHCNAEIPVLLEWQAMGMIPAGLEIVAVSTAVADDRPNFPPSEWLVEMGWTWDAMADSAEMTAASAYGVTGYPFMVITGPDGVVKGRTSGEKGLEALDAWVIETLGR